MKKILVLILLIGVTACSFKKQEEKGMVLHFATSAKLKGLDPIYAQDTYSNSEIIRVYETLLQYHPFKRPYTLEPLLADSLPKIAKNGLQYTFKIRQGVFFHNDASFPNGKGRELVAEDFVYSFKRLADPKLPATGWWLLDERVVGLNEWRAEAQKSSPDYAKEVIGLRALDKYTLQITLKQPYPQFLYALAMPYMSAVPHEAVEKYGKDMINHAVGTGPFVLESYKPSEVVTYIKNPNYWTAKYPSEGVPAEFAADAGKPLPFADRVEVRVIVEDQPRWMHFLRGEIDLSGIPKDNFKQAMTPGKELSKEFVAKGIILTKESAMDLTYTAFNLESTEIPQFKDKRIRQAISLAYDTKESIELFFNNMAIPAQTVIPPGIPGADLDFKNPYRVLDLEKAKKLLAEAGYPGGKGFPVITYDTLADTTSRQMYEYFEKKMEKIGISTKINSNTWPSLLERIQRRQTQMWGLAWGADYPDAENFLQLFYSPNAQPGGMNGSYYKNKEYDKIFEKARVMQDSPARTKLYKQLAQILAEDTPVILELHRLAVGLQQPWLKNYKYSEFHINQAKYLKIDADLKKQFKK